MYRVFPFWTSVAIAFHVSGYALDSSMSMSGCVDRSADDILGETDVTYFAGSIVTSHRGKIGTFCVRVRIFGKV